MCRGSRVLRSQTLNCPSFARQQMYECFLVSFSFSFLSCGSLVAQASSPRSSGGSSLGRPTPTSPKPRARVEAASSSSSTQIVGPSSPLRPRRVLSAQRGQLRATDEPLQQQEQ